MAATFISFFRKHLKFTKYKAYYKKVNLWYFLFNLFKKLLYSHFRSLTESFLFGRENVFKKQNIMLKNHIF